MPDYEVAFRKNGMRFNERISATDIQAAVTTALAKATEQDWIVRTVNFITPPLTYIYKEEKEMAYTTKEIKTYPLASGMPQVNSGAEAWGWGAWVQIVPSDIITEDFLILAVLVQMNSFDISHPFFVQVGIGSEGSEVPIITVWGFHEHHSLVGRILTGYHIPLPITRKVLANSRVVIRTCDSNEVGLVYYGGIQYVEMPLGEV